MSLLVYIPTRGRLGLNRQVTLREFMSKSTHKPIVVCPRDETAQHRKYYGRVIGCPAVGIGPTRQWILENSAADIVVMADDDMRFFYRPDVRSPELAVCTNLDPLLAYIEELVAEGYIHGGVGARQGNNRKDMGTRRKGWLTSEGRLVQDNERVNNFHFVLREKVLELGARFDRLPVMEDFHFSLYLITRGYPNLIVHDHVWNQEGSGLHGGCSLYRTPQVQAAGANGLAAAYPEYVKVVTKTSKDTSTAWKDFKERTDVVVYWLKAWEQEGLPRARRLKGTPGLVTA